MPLPVPREEERESEFISRCMDNDITKRDFPDSKQRVTVCYSQWRKKK